MQELISNIYGAAAGTKAWRDALTRITADLGLLGAQFVGISSTRSAILFSHGSANNPSEAEIEYVRTYHRFDPRMPIVLRSPAGQWLYDQDAFDQSVAVTNPYYRDLLMAHGGRFTASTKLLESGNEVFLLAFVAPPGLNGFSDENRRLLDVMSFHLKEAAEIYQKTRRLVTAASVGQEIITRMTRPAFLLSSSRTVSILNDRARTYLSRCDELLLMNERLVARDRKTDSLLEGIFSNLETIRPLAEAPERRVVRLAGNRADFASALSLTPFVPKDSMYAFGSSTQVLAVVHAPTSHTAPDVLLWEAAFNLTPSQSRVALELFNGRTTREAAAVLGIAEPTVKSHLNEVYSKTGVSRRSQLVLMLAGLERR